MNFATCYSSSKMVLLRISVLCPCLQIVLHSTFNNKRKNDHETYSNRAYNTKAIHETKKHIISKDIRVYIVMLCNVVDMEGKALENSALCVKLSVI